MASFDTWTSAVEGLIVMACGARVVHRAVKADEWVLATLWTFQGLMFLAWAAWRNDQIIRAMNDWAPMWVEIIAYVLMAILFALERRSKRNL